MEQKVLNVGLIGFGVAGQVFHAPTITAVPGLRLAKVVERHGNKASSRYPGVMSVPYVEDVLTDPNIDLVIVATPNATHFDLARQAILAGKHVIVDKPFAVTFSETQELIRLAKQKQNVLSVYQNRRWDGDFLTVKRVVEGDFLGKLVEYEAHYDRFVNYIRPSTWKEKEGPGSGILYDLGSHLVDQALVLFGVPKTITADIRIQRENSDIEDSFELIMGYDQLKVTLKGGLLIREPGPRYTLHGTQGSFIKFGLDPQEEALKQGATPGAGSAWGVESPETWGTLNTTLNGIHFVGKIETIPGNYLAFYHNIYDVIVNGAEQMVDPEEASNIIRIIETAMDSQARRMTVDIS
ncbi:oxidoreductase [Desulfosporosinus sp. SB140]|uniref:oxidoreductase n=1 Tax=Desulfosporosinus paludis TaxID=3115649 RepID=UPI003890A2F6